MPKHVQCTTDVCEMEKCLISNGKTDTRDLTRWCGRKKQNTSTRNMFEKKTCLTCSTIRSMPIHIAVHWRTQIFSLHRWICFFYCFCFNFFAVVVFVA